MLTLRKIVSRSLRWCERSVGRFNLLTAPRVTYGHATKAGYGVRLRAVMGGTITIGNNVAIDRNVDLYAREAALIVGDDCFIGRGCVIVGRNAINIGKGCQIAEYVTIRDQDHIVIPGEPITKSGFQTAAVTIGENVWIGAKATITKGVFIGDGAIIGAGAVVTRDIPAGARAVGIPARPLTSSTEDENKKDTE